ncbi:hypothetical protein JKP88DRAFT_255510 [Tribonema minus]|uniref:Uncharacterized protein n=1 Tax=Tribonema minus TaxID=303371 RepID=A0A836CG41_9STRA|nr:hypothetical protein JKP88DRAFT_255497 [Tribonema minus]KAG5184289.1 hypothetical protein JKP88DRAFT_255510 [Tribonema minus]
MESMDGNKQHKTCDRQQGTSQYIGCFSAVHIACVHDLVVIADKSTQVGTTVLNADTPVRLDRDYVAREVASDQSAIMQRAQREQCLAQAIKDAQPTIRPDALHGVPDEVAQRHSTWSSRRRRQLIH